MINWASFAVGFFGMVVSPDGFSFWLLLLAFFLNPEGALCAEDPYSRAINRFFRPVPRGYRDSLAPLGLREKLPRAQTAGVLITAITRDQGDYIILLRVASRPIAVGSSTLAWE
jgi:hypothetical protein